MSTLTLNRIGKDSYSDRSYLVPELREKVEPFLFPETLPEKKILDRIFQGCALISVEDVENLGFKQIAFGRTVSVMSHKSLPKYVIKVVRSEENNTPKEGYHRVNAHRQAKILVEKEKMKRVAPSENWLYPIPQADEKEINNYTEFRENKEELKATVSEKEYTEIKNRANGIFSNRLLVIEIKIESIPFKLNGKSDPIAQIVHEYVTFLLLSGEPDAHRKNMLLSKDRRIIFIDLAKWEKNDKKREMNGVNALRKDNTIRLDYAEEWVSETESIVGRLQYDESKEAMQGHIKTFKCALTSEETPLQPKTTFSLFNFIFCFSCFEK